MSELILYNYPLSPFSEKIRAMLGFTGLSWRSIIVPEMPPRPVIDELTGGYRRIPVAQFGADIFCDTRIIAAEIAALAAEPVLDPALLDPDMRAFAARADSEIFFVCANTASSLKLLGKIIKSTSLMHFLRLIADRTRMSREITASVPRGKLAKRILHDFLTGLETRLGTGFLFGPRPNYADFSAYHSLWFVRDFAEGRAISGFANVNVWMDRIGAFGHGTCTEISGADALRIAAEADPRPLPAQLTADPLIGKQVAIAPTDYGLAPSVGVLVGSTAERWILKREFRRATVHVHFPKDGFRLNP